MGYVLLGAMVGAMAAVVSLFMGASGLSAFGVYAGTGAIVMVGAVVGHALRGAEEADTPYPAARTEPSAHEHEHEHSLIGPPAPARSTMDQWLDDPESQPVQDDTQSKVA